MSIKVGMLGFAHGHVNAYCTQWRQTPEHGVEVVAGWDHDSGRLAKNAESYPIQPYASLDDCLAHPGLQAVVIGAEYCTSFAFKGSTPSPMLTTTRMPALRSDCMPFPEPRLNEVIGTISKVMSLPSVVFTTTLFLSIDEMVPISL